MTIIDKIAEALYIELCKPHLEETTAIKRAAQAAWEVVKAEMLGDDFMLPFARHINEEDDGSHIIRGAVYNESVGEVKPIEIFAYAKKIPTLEAALTAAMQKMEE